jgi:hypothetical protein
MICTCSAQKHFGTEKEIAQKVALGALSLYGVWLAHQHVMVMPERFSF